LPCRLVDVDERLNFAIGHRPPERPAGQVGKDFLRAAAFFRYGSWPAGEDSAPAGSISRTAGVKRSGHVHAIDLEPVDTPEVCREPRAVPPRIPFRVTRFPFELLLPQRNAEDSRARFDAQTRLDGPYVRWRFGSPAFSR